MVELMRLCSYEVQCQIVNEVIDFMGIDIDSLADSKSGK